MFLYHWVYFVATKFVVFNTFLRNPQVAIKVITFFSKCLKWFYTDSVGVVQGGSEQLDSSLWSAAKDVFIYYDFPVTAILQKYTHFIINNYY